MVKNTKTRQDETDERRLSCARQQRLGSFHLKSDEDEGLCWQKIRPDFVPALPICREIGEATVTVLVSHKVD